MQTISKYFVAFLLTLLSSVYGDKEVEEQETENVLKSTIERTSPCTGLPESEQAGLFII